MEIIKKNISEWIKNSDWWYNNNDDDLIPLPCQYIESEEVNNLEEFKQLV